MASVNIIGVRVGAGHSQFQKLLTEIHYYTEQRGNQAVGNNFKAPKNQDQKERVNRMSPKMSAFFSVLCFGNSKLLPNVLLTSPSFRAFN